MKTILTFSTMIIAGLLVTQGANCQDSQNQTLAYNTTTTNVESSGTANYKPEAKAAPTKDDVVVNMAMIESFRRCYDKIQPFSFADYFRGDGSEISAKYMALMRARYNTSQSENIVSTELEGVKSDLQKKSKFNSQIAFYEDSKAQQLFESKMENLLVAKTQETKNESIPSNNSGKDKPKSVKWKKLKN